MDRRQVLGAGVALAALPGAGWAQGAEPAWVRLPTEPYRGKQDDVVFVDAIPLGATGKMQKNKLREQFKDHRLPTATS
jgi:acyl-coenzyme A synthetase/AMP-(fatty) acid ligase